MAELLVITGHGAGDPGACGNGFQEAERVRALAKRIAHFGGDDVLLCDMERNYYKDKGIYDLTIPKTCKILELHMDCSTSKSAKGAHVIILGEYKPDEYDKKLAEFMTGIFPGRSTAIVGRTNLANVIRAKDKGYNYRLLECCFISNAEDVKKFNEEMDDIAKGILASFDISVKEEKKPAAVKPSAPAKSLEDWAKEVIAGKHGSGHANREASLKKAKCPYTYDKIRTKVNELCGVKTSAPSKSLDEWAKEVIAGKHGIGHAKRKASLKKAGCKYSYTKVRNRVNALSK